MKTTKTTLICLFAAVIGLSFNACKKDAGTTTSDTATEEAGVSASTSDVSSEMMYDDAFDVVNQSSEQSSLTVNSTSGSTVINSLGTYSVPVTDSFTTIAGATITLLPADPSVFPKTMTIDYGAGVTSSNGVVRKGQIIVSLSGKIRVAGSTISVTFNNYSVNGYQLTGTYALTPQIVSGGGVNYTATVTNGGITFPNGQAYTYSGTETFTQTAGIGTTSITDDTYEITGSFSFKDSAGDSITGNVSSPLVKSADCKDITSGTVAFTYKGLKGTLDFGSGTCDNIATVKFGLTTKTITLPR